MRLSIAILFVITALNDAHAVDISRTAPIVVFSQDRIIEAVSWSLSADGAMVCSVAAGDRARVKVSSPGFLDANISGREWELSDTAVHHAFPAVESRPAVGPSTSAPAVSRPAGERSVLAYIQLTNNEVLRGTIRDCDRPDVLAVDVDRLGPQRLSMKAVVAISFNGHAPAARSADRTGKPPYLLLANGDLLAGNIGAIGTGGVTVASDFGQTRVEWSRVSAVFLASGPTDADGRQPGEFLCVLADGQRWHADALAPGPTPQEVSLRRGQAFANIPVALVRQLVFPGWTFQDLTRQGAAKVETTSYLDEIVQVVCDDPVHQRRRSIARRWFATGLTTRPRSSVTYALPPSALYLSGWVGLDTLRGRFGNCDVRVDIAGQTVAAFKGLTARQSARRIAVPLRGAGQVSLVTDFGPNGEIGDCVNWCDLVLIARQADR